MSARGTEVGLGPLSGRRLAAFLVLCIAAATVLEAPLAIRGAEPDFVVVALVYGAIRWGATGGALLGFGLGLFRDTLDLADFGLHALAMTLAGYGLGKLRETLYLSTPGIDVPLVVGTKLVLDLVVLATATGSWPAFEQRFFWEVPGSALYTAVLGGGLRRLFERR